MARYGPGSFFIMFFIFLIFVQVNDNTIDEQAESNRKEDRDSVRDGKTNYYRRTEMDFIETRMGKSFYEGTMPRLCRAIEELNRKLDRRIDESPKTDIGSLSSPFEWANFKTDDTMLKQAAEFAASQGEKEEFTAMVINEIVTDSDGSASRLIEDYRRASIEERRVIDGIFIDLTGWSFSTLVKKYLETVKKQSKEEE